MYCNCRRCFVVSRYVVVGVEAVFRVDVACFDRLGMPPEGAAMCLLDTQCSQRCGCVRQTSRHERQTRVLLVYRISTAGPHGLAASARHSREPAGTLMARVFWGRPLNTNIVKTILLVS